jgi:hypothetical protein
MRFEPDIGTYSVGFALGIDRRGENVDVAADAAARLAQKKAANVIEVALHRAHALVHGGALRRQETADDDIADLPFRVAANDREHRSTSHDGPRLACFYLEGESRSCEAGLRAPLRQ